MTFSSLEKCLKGFEATDLDFTIIKKKPKFVRVVKFTLGYTVPIGAGFLCVLLINYLAFDKHSSHM